MADTTDTDPIARSVTLTVRESVPSSFAPLYSALVSMVRSIPTYNDTKKGRRNATQIKFGLIIVGVLSIAFGKSLLWVIVGCLLTVIALIAPLESSRRIALVSSLKRGMRTVTTSQHSVDLVKRKNRVVVINAPDELSFSIKKRPRHVRKEDESLVGFRGTDGVRVWLRSDLDGGDSAEKDERFDLIIDVEPEVVEELRRG